MIEKYLELVDAKIYYKTIGEGTPILFLHGGPGLAHDYFLPHFLQLSSKGFQLIFFDQRGGGKSANPYHKDSISIENIIDDIENLRKELCLKTINIFGHSFGGFLAVNYALKYKDKVNKLILCNSTAFTKELCDIEENTMNERMKEYDNEMMAYFYNKDLLKKLVVGPDFINEKVIEITAKKLMEEFFNIIQSINLKDIQIPTVVIHSDYDFIPYESSVRIAEEIQNSSLELIENCGHFTFIEKCDEICQIVMEFVAKA